ncbi:tRNA (5-methylaminomethyl-2-thiouridine)(34)-methyltransferase MnmD [Flavobacterium amniphilum]|uniref:tRNA (5-methylaminomethyl-2-thiouridine)(34)-methyltransferase MnmD n=1 Tax=Flavobacterium amniphilum TaxID=1834035 RepID=UPI00202A6695|nr:tRNA (5-methylaminomethyl-2-thiouridine)(34)-methyltransferase MnmD [Flavobacterium amniphilum]MCL9805417.1 tRNA (5-methylaminomethyl-2-thiouridine)(34)-methyltransferase MnmD [Flavobacterium amniphilum]
MERKIITTLDGSTTIQLVNWDECYHSKNGAVQEAQHVFISNGLYLLEGKSVSVLEIGFGTGLNAFVTYLESQKNNYSIDYVGVEAYPVKEDEAFAMNYVETLDASQYENVFKLMHQCSWEERNEISPDFFLTKKQQLFQEIDFVNQFDIVFFDAFGYQVQPELWSTEIFGKMYMALKEKGILVTYAARGVVKRSLLEVGFQVKKMPGPPGKREMMVGFKSV